MGWGLLIKNVYLNRVSKDKLAANIKNTEHLIQNIEIELIALAASTSKDITVGEDRSEPRHIYVAREVRELLTEYKESSGLLYLMYQAADSYEPDIELIELGFIARLKRWWKKEKDPLLPKEIEDDT